MPGTELKFSFDIKLFTINPSLLFARLAPEQGNEHLKNAKPEHQSKAGTQRMEIQGRTLFYGVSMSK